MAYSDEVLADSPALYWRLNETTPGTGTCADSSGNGRNGTYVASPTSVVSLLPSGEDKAVTFNGSSQWVTSTYNPFATGSNRTFEMWVKRTNTSTQDAMFGGDVASVQPLFVQPITVDTIIFFTSAASGGKTWTGPFGVGVARHIVLTWTGGTLTSELWVNGVSQGTMVHSTDFNVAPGNFTIARRSTASDPYLGVLDEVAIYTSVLSSSRIQAHYLAGQAAFVPSDPLLFHEIAGPGGSYGMNAFVEELQPVAVAAGPATILQDVIADAVLVTASMVRQVNKNVTGTAVAVTGSIVKQVGKFLTATTVAVTASLVAVKVKLLTMTATTVVVTASMVKQVNKILTATTVLVTGSLRKQVNKLLTATTVVVTATLATVKVKLLAMTATAVVVTATMVRQVGKPLTATAVAVTGSIVKQVNKAVKATNVVVSASMTQLKVILKAMTATAVVVTGSMSRRVNTALNATVAVGASVVKAITHRLTATVSATASLVATFAGPIVGPFKALLAVVDFFRDDVTATDTSGADVQAVDATGTDIGISDAVSPEAASVDAAGADVTIDDIN